MGDTETISRALEFSRGNEVVPSLAEGLDTYGDGVEGVSRASNWTIPRVKPPRKWTPPLLLTTTKDPNEDKPNSEKLQLDNEEGATEISGASEPADSDTDTASSEKEKDPFNRKEKREALQRETGSFIWEGSLRSEEEYDQDLWVPSEEPPKRKMSGGQWQRLCLARSFMKKENDLIVLDEPTGPLDPKSEAAFFDNVFGLRGKVSLSSGKFGIVD